MAMRKSLSLQTPLLLLVLLLCGACARHAGNTVHQLDSPAKYGVDRFTTQQKHNAHYVEVGIGEPVILIPGLFGTYRGWNRMIPFLAPHYKLIAIDNFGTGDSEMPDDSFGYTVAEQADMIIQMMDELGLSRGALLGVSYGGMIALNIAARYPDRVSAVVCIEGGVIMPKPAPYRLMEQGLAVPILGDAIIAMIRSGLLNGVIAKDLMGPAWADLDDREKSEISEIIAGNVQAASRPIWRSLARALNSAEDFTEEAKAITAPVLYLSGDRSSFREMTETNIAYLRNTLPYVKTVSFADGIHDLQLQKPQETAVLTLNFLAPYPSSQLTSTVLAEKFKEPRQGHSLPIPSPHDRSDGIYQ